MASKLFVGNDPEEHQDNAPTILMRFELSQQNKLSNLRIPITNIIMATLHLPLNTELRVELIRSGLPILVKAAVQTATLYRLQRQLFVFLADILDLHPNRSAQTYPYVMMDGNCQIEEVECGRKDGSKFLVQNLKSELDSDEMEEEMDYHINRLIEQNAPDLATYVSVIQHENDRHPRYDMSAPHDPSLRGVAIKPACFLQEAGTTDGYYD
jgi:hypothetical protein